ncbi:hypothetical protein Aperf_G00000022931 [Anoplocephala perfoliata]
MAYVPERILECTICLNRLKDPRSLTCSHIFCKICIIDWLSTHTTCPICNKPAKPADLKQLYVLDDILNNLNKPPCENCNKTGYELKKCDHCSKNVCSPCEVEHIEEVIAEVREASSELTSVSLPGMEELHEKVGILMSESASLKEKMLVQLRKAHEALVDQIVTLQSKGEDMIKQSMGNSNLNAQIEDVENLITRARTCISESVKILANKDLKALVDLDSVVDRLLMDINDFQAKYEKSGYNQVDSPKNLKINPAYNMIANMIEATELVRKSNA